MNTYNITIPITLPQHLETRFQRFINGVINNPNPEEILNKWCKSHITLKINENSPNLISLEKYLLSFLDETISHKYTKNCSKCNRSLRAKDFYKREYKHNKDGLTPDCKECRKATKKKQKE